MGDSGQPLEHAIAVLYGGPLEDFVRRRDALAKELRAAGDRASAATVKGLRKPSRIAWALDLGACESNAIDPLVTAVAATLDAQAAGGDVRAAIGSLRATVREFAGRAAHAAEQAGHRIEPAVLANAVLAVLGTQESFDQLRAGRLAEVPAAGGLDFLDTLPAPTGPLPSVTPPRAASRRDAAAGTASPAPMQPGAAARDAAQQAASALAGARADAQAAEQALREAESTLAAAEARMRQVEEEVRAARGECDRLRREAEAAAARLRAARASVHQGAGSCH